MRSVVAIALLVAACSGPAASASPLVIGPDDDRLIDFRGGAYTVAWEASCENDAFWLAIAPTSSADPIEIPMAGAASGSVDVEIPAGPAWINHAGGCEGIPPTVIVTRR